MAKTPKFTDEKLLEAVVKYANEHRGKIEATKLARWASENIEGLEGVEDRHFTRPEEKKDPKTGKKVKKMKLCTAKINELNAARSNMAAMNTNVLLKSSSIDKFFELPRHVQRQTIIDTRNQVESLMAENRCLRQESGAVAAKMRITAAEVERLRQEFRSVKETHAKLVKLVSRAMDEIDAQKRKEMLESIGVCDGRFDLNTYVDSLMENVNAIPSFNEIIQKDFAARSAFGRDDLMGGIDFG